MISPKKNPEIRALLRKSGSKATPARLLVLSLLQHAKRPVSAQNVIDMVRHKVDQATIYRIFKDLNAKGVIRPIDLRHNHAHYELASMDEHHHLICIRCGRVEDVRGCGIEEMQDTLLKRTRHFAEIRQHSLEFYGICKTCHKKPEGTAPAHPLS